VRRVDNKQSKTLSNENTGEELSSKVMVWTSMRQSLKLSMSSLLHSEVLPSEIHGLQEIEMEDDGTFSCFLWQQSRFYTKATRSYNAWQLRWFSFTEEEMTSFPDKASWESREHSYPKMSNVLVDEKNLLLKVSFASSSAKDLVLRAPNGDILKTVEDKVVKIMTAAGVSIDEVDNESVESTMSEDIENLIEWPTNGSLIEKLFFILFFPLRISIHYTNPDVRLDTSGDLPIVKSYFASISSVVWFVILSYIMVSSLETIGKLLGVPSSVIGVTVSAVGTSYPNLLASQASARAGLGNMALGNAFGSNVFNILVALGFPWLAYCLYTGKEYHGLKDEGISTEVFILLFFLVAYIIMIMMSGWVLYRYHAFICIWAYFGYLVYVIGSIFFDW